MPDKKLYGAVWRRHVKANATKIQTALTSGIGVYSHSGGRLGEVVGVDSQGWCRIKHQGKETGVTRFGNEIRIKRLGAGFVVLDRFE